MSVVSETIDNMPPLFSLGQALLIRGPRRYGTHEALLCFWTTLIPAKIGAVTSWETPVVGQSQFGSFPLTFSDDLLSARPISPLGFQFLRQGPNAVLARRMSTSKLLQELLLT
jgi:hypothetical protein